MYELDPHEYSQWKETIDWDDYLEYAEANGYKWKDIKWLKQMERYSPSWKQIKAAKWVVEKIDKERDS